MVSMGAMPGAAELTGENRGTFLLPDEEPTNEAPGSLRHARPCRLRAFRGVGINLSSGDRGVERRRVLRGR